MNIPKSKSVPAIIISDYDSEDPFPKLNPAEGKNKIPNKGNTCPTNSFEEKQEIEIKKPEVPLLPTNKEKRGGEGDKNRAAGTKAKVGSHRHFII